MQHDFKREECKLLSAITTFFGLSSKGKTGEELIALQTAQESLFKDMGRLKMYCCGGAVTSVFSNAAINDIDIYVENESDIPEATEFLKKVTGDNEPWVSDNAITYVRKGSGRRVYRTQLIKAFTGKPAEIFWSFDFTICMGAYNFAERKFEMDNRFLADLAGRRLVYSGGSRYPICAMYRTSKYQDRGFKLPGSTVMHIALAIVKLEIKTYGVLKEQLQGIDTMFLGAYLSTKDSETPVDIGEFLYHAFKLIDEHGMTTADTEEEENADC